MNIILLKNGEEKIIMCKDISFLNPILLIELPFKKNEKTGVDKYVLKDTYSAYIKEGCGLGIIEHTAIYEFEKNIDMYLTDIKNSYNKVCNGNR